MKVQIVDIDEEKKRFGGRILEVNRKINTPFRVSSSVDYKSKQEIPTDIKIDSEFSEVVSDFNNKELDKFLSKNGPFSSRIRTDEQKADIMSYSSIISYYPQLPKNRPLNQKGMKLILELELNIENVNVISIPMFTPIDSYEKELRVYCEVIKDRGKDPMPILDMALEEKEFKSKFDAICSNIETGLISIMGLRYRNWQENIQNFYHIWENKEKEILYYCIGVDRKFNQASTMHILQSWGIDVYSIKMKRGYGTRNGDKKKKEKKKILNFDIFDRETIGILKLNQYKSEHPNEELNCDCPMCHNLDLDSFIEHYGYNENGEKDALQLQYAGKLHEFFSSSKEFDISRTSIKEGKLLNYFNSKKYLRNTGRGGTLDNHIL